ncbi:cell division ATP-binding protein FtsE [Desulfohalobium retbaense]|uniref:Cell division ATP-binding protein FtsE n=1 Tax=Desulfohalobium retbaense (strain ATCC 49708 / DSM 5692 / JCM 16813 / HR100) TaxID=485915 RepID=C8WZ34_DESRD|nr:cell division ATP-binding protein FtsE [Desulfohalobium retbaense]ACV67309.1 cell division ATP-binding protein FtsE [Desulfohalobium retbaense DSM 5692]
MVEIEHLSYAFGRSWALQDVSFRIDPGDFLFLTGPSGAGKTTLLRMLHGSLPVQRGRARVAGFELNTLKRRHIPKLRRHVSVVFQDFKVLPRRTVFANVAIALEVRGMQREQLRRRVRAVLRSLGLEAKQHRPCGELSGGEQQRVAIARAVVVNPDLLLADEPTGNLDARLSARLLDVFRRFHAHGTTVILATHNRQVLESEPQAKIVCLKEGKMVGDNFLKGQSEAEQGL